MQSKSFFISLILLSISCYAPYYQDSYISLNGKYSSSEHLKDDYISFVATVNDNYLDSQCKPIQLDTTNHPSIDSLLKQIDFHSFIYDVGDNSCNAPGDVGLQNVIVENYPIVISPIISSPAYRAGIMPGDTLVSINSMAMKNITKHSVRCLLGGDDGTPCTVTVKRSDQQIKTFVLTRENMNLKSTISTNLFNQVIGYVHISEFRERTSDDLKSACDSLKKNGAELLIIDIRNNCGGMLGDVLSSASLFLPKGSIISRIKQHVRIGDETYVCKSLRRTRIPLILLVNSYTCSGAEAFAAALHDNDRARLIGLKTYGDGSVQSLIRVKSLIDIEYQMKGMRVLFTTGYLITPSGMPIEKRGVLPDIIINEPKDFLQEQFPADNWNNQTIITDKQLLASIKLAGEIIAKSKKRKNKSL